MIVMEDYYVGDIKFNRIHSDKERFIERDGRKYLEVIELAPTMDEFVEGDTYGEEYAKDILGTILGEGDL